MRVAVDRGDGLGHGLCSAAVAQEQGGPGTPGGTLLGRGGHRSVAGVHLVSHLAAPALLGPPAAGYRSHARARGRSRETGDAWRRQVRQLFHGWHRVRDGTLRHASLARYRRPIRHEVERWLEAGQPCGVPKTEGGGRESLKRRQALWPCVRHPGVEPTHHAAERAIRPGVLWRTGRFGTHSPKGSRVVETLMTVVAPLKPQHRSLLDDLTAACAAALRGEPAPSLLPTPTAIEQWLCPAA